MGGQREKDVQRQILWLEPIAGSQEAQKYILGFSCECYSCEVLANQVCPQVSLNIHLRLTIHEIAISSGDNHS